MAAPNQLSFLPDDYIERKQRRRTNLLCASLFVLVIGSVLAAFTVTRQSLASLEAQYTSTGVEYTEKAKRIEQVNEMKSKQKTMSTQAELSAGLLEKVSRSHLLAEVTNSMPTGVSLLEFDMQSKARSAAPPQAVKSTATITVQDATKAAAPAPPQPRQYDVYMKIQGVAVNDSQVATFITKLSNSKLFKDVNLVISEEFDIAKSEKSDAGKVRKFVIEFSLDPTARVLTDGTKVSANEEGGK